MQAKLYLAECVFFGRSSTKKSNYNYSNMLISEICIKLKRHYHGFGVKLFLVIILRLF